MNGGVPVRNRHSWVTTVIVMLKKFFTVHSPTQKGTSKAFSERSRVTKPFRPTIPVPLPPVTVECVPQSVGESRLAA